MFLIREADTHDTKDLLLLAKQASFINLPPDTSLLQKKILRSQQSFKGKIKDPKEAEYLFVLEDCQKKKVIGSSLLIAQHGTPHEPHTYFQVLTKKKVSKSLHLGFLHQVLRLGFDYNGPTEIGGLILLPEYRSHPQKLGRLLSFVRFMYIAARRSHFRSHVLSELMPPLNERGESPLWEELGRKFTNMAYQEADRVSRRNKEFITSLFPEGDIYTCLLPTEAREAIGQVNPHTLPVRHMLEKIGFSYTHMIDPFDGGPHYWAKAEKISIVKQTRHVKLLTEIKKTQRTHPKTGYLMSLSPKGLRAGICSLETIKSSKNILEMSCSSETQKELQVNPQTEAYFYETEVT